MWLSWYSWLRTLRFSRTPRIRRRRAQNVADTTDSPRAVACIRFVSPWLLVNRRHCFVAVLSGLGSRNLSRTISSVERIANWLNTKPPMPPPMPVPQIPMCHRSPIIEPTPAQVPQANRPIHVFPLLNPPLQHSRQIRFLSAAENAANSGGEGDVQ